MTQLEVHVQRLVAEADVGSLEGTRLKAKPVGPTAYTTPVDRMMRVSAQ